MPRNQHITRTKGVCGGEPCIAGTRITTRHVWDFRPWSMAQIRESHLTIAQVDAALRYERRWYRRLGRRVEAARQRLGRWALYE